MISPTAWHDSSVQNWRIAIANSITDPEELIEILKLPQGLLFAARAAAERFGLRVPREFVALMERGNVDDPLLRQILPVADELLENSNFNTDPVGDQKAILMQGVLSKYQGRVLLITTSACAVHCRYCLRRTFPYNEQHISNKQWGLILDGLKLNTGIHEVILSGGDPLALGDDKLAELIAEIGTVSHVRRLRIHTRLPVLIPQRITEKLLQILSNTGLKLVVVVHVNHPRELSDSATMALSKLRSIALLLNQSVLLRGVNDKLEVLLELSERLFDIGILPYYIHLLDRVQGSAHFEVATDVAITLMEQMRQHLPGYLVPRLAREDQGALSKTILM